MDNFRIDSHKLMYHVNRVNDWLNGENVYPIYMEISPVGLCNHRCIFCAVDYLGYKPISLNFERFEAIIQEAGAKGVKSVMFAGGGEPLLHKEISEMIEAAARAGIDGAITSNAVMLTEEKAQRILKHLTWFRASLNAGTPKTYSLIHKTKETDFRTVLKNLKYATSYRNKNNLKSTIGAQTLLLPENKDEMPALINELKSIGLDYLIIKPYSQHPQSINQLGDVLDYDEYLHLEESFNRFSSDTFEVIFRKNAMSKVGKEKPYRQSYGLAFFTYLDEKGDLYPCIEYSGNPEFIFGNIYEQTFTEIWEGERRQEVMKLVNNEENLIHAKRLTRVEEINEYLWNLKHPPAHANFI